MQNVLNDLAQKDIKLYLEYNALLQTRKSELRNMFINEKIANEIFNDSVKTFDCLNKFLTENRLELKLDIIDETTEVFEHRKDCYHVISKIKIYLIDCETGFFETSIVTSESFSELDFNNARKKANKAAIDCYFSSIFFK